MIVDASIVVEMVLAEQRLPWVEKMLTAFSAEPLRMPWTNIAEVALVLRRKRPMAVPLLEPMLARATITPVSPDHQIVLLVADARERFPLNFGDCFAYAHAQRTGEPLFTLDADFLKTDLTNVVHPQTQP